MNTIERNKQYEVKREITVSASHKLDLPYDSKCNNLHGHNYKISVHIVTDELNTVGMVMDFKKIDEIVNIYDHAHLNDIIMNVNPTAEIMAEHICVNIVNELKSDNKIVTISVNETEKSTAIVKIKCGEYGGK